MEEKEKIIEIEIERLRDFKEHPFQVKDDEEMRQIKDSISEYGVLNPLIVRPRPEGVYEIISGHRRKYASQKLGYTKLPVIIRVMTDEEAVIAMVDSNLQREKISYSEKAYAYMMKNEALKRKGGRKRSQSSHRLKGKKTVELISEASGDSPKQVQRYIKITELIPELMQQLDDGNIGFNPAVEIAFLKKEEQKQLLKAMEYAQASPSLSQAQRIKKLSNGIITSLRDRSYRPRPAKRVYIAKKNSNKKRPLGIQSGNDKLVQKIVKMILESIYEPAFSNKSHGFRPNRSCQTALMQIQKTFTGTNWFVEGDIHACFDSFDHHVIVEILKKRIGDEMFTQLIWKFLKAGYMEQWEYERTYSGVPQGSGVSPVLCNIYLNELDKFMEKYAIDFNTKAPRKRLSPAYKTSVNRAYEYRKEGKQLWEQLSPEERKIRSKRLRELERAEKSMTPTVPLDANYKRIQYTRYADDFLIGVIGSKEDAEQVKRDVKAFLQDALKLEMSDTKTKVTHTGDRARFLGYDITVSRSQNMKKLANGKIQRCQTGVVKLLVPREKWVGKLLEYQAIKIKINENGKERFVALHRGKLVNKSDIEILATYNAEVRGLYHYYSIANDAFKIGRFGNVMKYSMYKTFACKYKTNVHEIKRRYCVGGLFTVAIFIFSHNGSSLLCKPGADKVTVRISS